MHGDGRTTPSEQKKGHHINIPIERAKKGLPNGEEGIKGSTSAADDAGRDRKLKSDGRLAQDKLKLMRKI
jgi:hypothetical protein